MGNTDWSSIRYRINSDTSVLIDDVRPGDSGTVNPVDITGLGSPVQLRYCLMDASLANNTRAWNCEEVEITRETKLPEITSSNPGDQNLVLAEDSFDFTVTVDGDPLPTIAVSSSDSQTVSVTDTSGGNYSLTGLAIGSSTITISAQDSAGRAASPQRFLVNVTQPDRSDPEITSANPGDQNIALAEGSFDFTVTVDGDPLPTIAVSSSDPQTVSVTDTSGGTYSLAGLAIGSSTITISAQDSDGRAASPQRFEVTVNADDTKLPEITSPNPGDQNLVLAEGSFDFTVTVDGDPLPTIAVSSSDPQTVSVADTLGGTYSLAGLAIGSSTITISAQDSAGRAASAQRFLVNVETSTVVIEDPDIVFNDVVADPVVMLPAEERSISFTVTDNSPDSLTFDASSSDALVATASVVEGNVVSGIRGTDTLLIDAKGEGSATISLSVTNSQNRQASLSVNVEVSKANTAPQANADSIIVSADDRVRLLDVLSNDTDEESNTLSIVLSTDRSVLGNAVSISDGKVEYGLTAALLEIDSFSYRAEDADGLQSGAVTVTLTPSDGDADNIVDAVDNCPTLSNTDQGNMDSDDLGDVCDEDPDGDGVPGISGAPFVSGKELVEEKCLTCHLTGTSGAPKFGDDADWDARIAAVGGDPANLLDSVVNGKLPLMPAFGAQESHQRLLQATLYLSGREVIPNGEDTGPEMDEPDVDSDTIPDAVDNCPTVPNNDQLNSDDTPAGDACEPLADRDGDGFPFSIDDDDGNANRLIATLPVVTNSTVFNSSGNLKVGRVATAVAQSVDYAQASIVLSDQAFVQGVSQVFPGVTVGPDTSFSSLMGVINIEATSSAGRSEFIMHLSFNLPLDPAMRVFNTGSGLWSHFQIGDAGQLDSAPATNSGCPNRESANYQSGLIAGLSCVRVRFRDGGGNDADGIANDRAELMVNIAGGIAMGDGSPVTIDTSPSKSSSGATSPWFLLVLLSFAACFAGLKALKLRQVFRGA